MNELLKAIPMQCPLCQRHLLSQQLVVNPNWVPKCSNCDNIPHFPQDYVCASCKDTILEIDTTPDYFEDGGSNTDEPF